MNTVVSYTRNTALVAGGLRFHRGRVERSRPGRRALEEAAHAGEDERLGASGDLPWGGEGQGAANASILAGCDTRVPLSYYCPSLSICAYRRTRLGGPVS
jgi:hypothetical protein